MAQILARTTLGDKHQLSLNASPSAGAGTPAPIGSMAQVNAAGMVSLWLKTGALDTQWTMVQAGSPTDGWNISYDIAGLDTPNAEAYFGSSDSASDSDIIFVRYGIEAMRFRNDNNVIFSQPVQVITAPNKTLNLFSNALGFNDLISGASAGMSFNGGILLIDTTQTTELRMVSKTEVYKLPNNDQILNELSSTLSGAISDEEEDRNIDIVLPVGKPKKVKIDIFFSANGGVNFIQEKTVALNADNTFLYDQDDFSSPSNTIRCVPQENAGTGIRLALTGLGGMNQKTFVVKYASLARVY